MSGRRTIDQTETAVQERLGQVMLLRQQMAAVSNIYRSAASVRQHLENSVLRGAGLTWTSFVVLWVVWIWGEMETRYVAEEVGISKGTLTGVARTLEGRGLLKRSGHPTDGRLVLLCLTPAGEDLMVDLFPRFNAEEGFVTGALSTEECEVLAGLLRRIVGTVEQDGEDRRAALAAGSALPPRRSGRRRREA